MTNPTETLTAKELLVARLFAQESIDCCGAFSEAENMSYMSAPDIAEATGFGLQAVGGIMTALENKVLIVNTHESPRGSRNPDFIACNLRFANFPQLADLVTE